MHDIYNYYFNPRDWLLRKKDENGLKLSQLNNKQIHDKIKSQRSSGETKF